MGRQFTNLFLLKHSSETPELKIRSEEEYRLFCELKRALNNTEINDDGKDIGFIFGDASVVFEDGKIRVYKENGIREEYSIPAFSRAPNAIFRKILSALKENGDET